jgi:AcrR family transcriptional regulator
MLILNKGSNPRRGRYAAIGQSEPNAAPSGPCLHAPVEKDAMRMGPPNPLATGASKPMAQRKDGQKTRARLLQAACKVFACKGFHQATVADICRQAGANVAAISYYFGDKAGLYLAAWQRAFENFSDRFLTDSAEDAAAGAETALRGQVRRLVLEFSRQDSTSEFARLYMLELARPSGLVDRSWHAMVNIRRQRLQGLIRAVLGPQAPEEDVLFCEMSIIN